MKFLQATSKSASSCVQEMLNTSLLKLNSELANRAVKMFVGIQRFAADGQEGMPTIMRYELSQKLLHQVFLFSHV